MTLESPLIAVINHLLSRQPALRAMLEGHAGKHAMIDAGWLKLTLQVAADGLLAVPADAAPNVTISVNPADISQIVANPERAISYVHISGDAEFARAISELANNLRWDAEEDLAPLVGDIAAVRLTQAARAAATQMRSGGRKLIENIAEYLLEENPMLLYRRAGEDFATDVATLRDDAERLAKRIALLEKRGEQA